MVVPSVTLSAYARPKTCKTPTSNDAIPTIVNVPQRATSPALQVVVFVPFTVVMKTLARTITPILKRIIPLIIFAITSHLAITVFNVTACLYIVSDSYLKDLFIYKATFSFWVYNIIFIYLFIYILLENCILAGV